MCCLQLLPAGDLTRGVVHEVQLQGLGAGSDSFTLLFDGSRASTLPDFDAVNFSVFDGPLYIGGHPQPASIQVRNNNYA